MLSVFEGRRRPARAPACTPAARRSRGARRTRCGSATSSTSRSPSPSSRGARAPLKPGLNYSYNVGFAPVQPGYDGDKPLEGRRARRRPYRPTSSSEGLLREPADRRPAAQRARLRGGRAAGLRAPAGVADRPADPPRLLPPAGVHVPGRRRGRQSFDGLAWVDDLILEWRRGTARRPPSTPTCGRTSSSSPATRSTPTTSSAAMLPMLNRVGNELVGRTEMLPTSYPPKNDAGEQAGLRRRAEPAGLRLARGVRQGPRDDGRTTRSRSSSRTARVRVLEDPLLRPRVPLVYAGPATRSTRASPQAPTRGAAHGRPTSPTSRPTAAGPSSSARRSSRRPTSPTT